MPYVHIDLDELDTSDLVEELERRGYTSSKTPETPPYVDGLDRVAHLASCGLTAHARDEALILISNAIGRPLN
jgi:hypothetical protein